MPGIASYQGRFVETADVEHINIRLLGHKLIPRLKQTLQGQLQGFRAIL